MMTTLAHRIILSLICGLPLPSSWALTVVSTHSEDASSSLLDEFRQLHPEIKITILNRRVDLIPSGVKSGSLRNADIVLSSSPFLMQALKNNGQLRTLPITQVSSPCAPKGLLLSDSERKYASYGLAGFGLLWNQSFYTRQRLAAPKTWQDLLIPTLHRQLVMSTPSRSSSTHMMLEKILQDEGWDHGWRTILQLGGQFSLIASRSFAVSEAIHSGDAMVSIMIDAHARPTMSANSNYRFQYLNSFAVMPSYVAQLRGGQHSREAKILVQYLFSEQGQRNLLNDRHFKLPLKGSLEQNGHLCRLFQQQKLINTEQILARGQLLKQLYDQLITLNFELLRDTQGLIQKAEASPNLSTAQKQDLITARQLASTPPVTAAQANDERYLALFRAGQPKDEISRWQQVWRAQLAQAGKLARHVLVNSSHD
ncbi:ABC transporter substrate-binding protein [Chitinibacter sp. SCUT-21]|uniref:ABC transporter substrate-binding protein n=1 Tax=Chitinibacter sp. SCUT-21 TaxID=2970891 RepID=UPI0035A628F7